MRPPTHRSGVLTISLVAVLGAAACTAPDAGEQTPSSDLPNRPVTDIDIHGILEKRVAMIPMRDGASLNTERSMATLQPPVADRT